MVARNGLFDVYSGEKHVLKAAYFQECAVFNHMSTATAWVWRSCSRLKVSQSNSAASCVRPSTISSTRDPSSSVRAEIYDWPAMARVG